MSFSFFLNSYILHSPGCQAWGLPLEAWCLLLAAVAPSKWRQANERTRTHTKVDFRTGVPKTSPFRT